MDLIKKEESKIASDFGGKYVNYDITYLPDGRKKPLIIFIHGFKGFKDWGHFPLIADYFAQNGFVFAKLNLSHNGTSPEHPVDFVDLEAFGNNNFTIELSDIQRFIDELYEGTLVPDEESNVKELYLIGHSRGGTTGIIASTLDSRIKKLATWAAVCHVFDRYTQDEQDEWKKEGVKYIYNSRTDQKMPIYYQLAEDLFKNREQYDIPLIAKKVNIPYLIVHGTKDQTVAMNDAKDIHSLVKHSVLELIKDADHTFGGKHPWDSKKLPHEALLTCQKTVDFLLK